MMALQMRLLLSALLCAPLMTFAASVETPLDRAPDRSHDVPALQNGARVFVAYCLTCHAASFMRYNRLRDIGFTNRQIKAELLYTTDRVGETMKVAMHRTDAERWFGMTPPDLSVIIRARTSERGPGEDYIYTYLRSFYRDPARPTGWNNLVVPNVAMHHVLWQLQGEQVLGDDHKLRLAKPGVLTPGQYDELVADLAAYLKYMGEPSAQQRRHVGVYVLIGLGVLLFFAFILKPLARKGAQHGTNEAAR